MDLATDSTRGFQKQDPRWHSRVDDVKTVDEVVELARDYLATLTPDEYKLLPASCRTLRVKAEDDIEYWTLKLSQRHTSDDPGIDEERTQDLFNHFLHASVRISQIRKRAAVGAQCN